MRFMKQDRETCAQPKSGDVLRVVEVLLMDSRHGAEIKKDLLKQCKVCTRSHSKLVSTTRAERERCDPVGGPPNLTSPSRGEAWLSFLFGRASSSCRRIHHGAEVHMNMAVGSSEESLRYPA
ncbi:hypothetical protein PGT21_017025 [Puccinia graminis f. sp. tritici]|uniref:Uncharacterized protein n=1 Tax=Puccinia graminis f. sp. tritici TaxID=56615 RepID=A0A5B0PJH3_PUCGR|nr:hypothetical protein PGT21_017025 [Puccinia graminis f. sp. tritici]